MAVYTDTVQLKTLEEVLKVAGVRQEETGIALYDDNKVLKDWINPYEMKLLGTEVDVYVDADGEYDLIPKGMPYDKDSTKAIYALTSIDWVVEGEVL